MASQNTRIPTHLDDPKYFLIFRADDAFIFVGCMAFGVLFHILGYTIIAAFAVCYIANKFRGSTQNGLLQHLMYWFGVPVGKGHTLINPFARRFIG